MLAIEKWGNKHPIVDGASAHLLSYPAPRVLTYAWSFGAIAGLCLVNQIITGVFLAMHYTPNCDFAFLSIEHIMNDVNYGWLIRYFHSNGASMFFIMIYFHIFKGLYHGSYIAPRKILWVSGILIFVLMMATAFLGYVLPWGQMSFWGATVITNLFSAIPFVGSSIVEWLWGGFSVDNPTLNRFFSLHYLLPFAIVGLVLVHLTLLHEKGSNNPVGINENVPVSYFYPNYYVKDLLAFFAFLVFFSLFVYFSPNALGHTDNDIPANALVTPPHIVPEWYFLPFYAILRSIPDKLGGVLAMGGAIVALLILPFIVTTVKRPIKYRTIYNFSYFLWLLNFFILGWIGQQPVISPYIEIGMASTAFYFFFLLVYFPLLTLFEAKLVNEEISKICKHVGIRFDEFDNYVRELHNVNYLDEKYKGAKHVRLSNNFLANGYRQFDKEHQQKIDQELSSQSKS